MRNQDHISGAYDHLKDVYRPSHADFTTDQKYGIRAHEGGGRSSARETIGRVAAGAVARNFYLFLQEYKSWHGYIRFIIFLDRTRLTMSRLMMLSLLPRCPDPGAATK